MDGAGGGPGASTGLVCPGGDGLGNAPPNEAPMDAERLSSDFRREERPEAADAAADAVVALRADGVRSCWALPEPVCCRSSASDGADNLSVACSAGVEEEEEGGR
mmetsp:Transcript_112709/g.351419  ORF Transcript_112709/g.351419 Transcript_112709/m.351419 type:complete len:105 (-) Transcript_112709:1201-1515(-)